MAGDGVRVRCPGCDGVHVTALLSGCRDILMGVPGEWSILQCTDCRLTFTDPIADETVLLKYYPSNYHVYHPSNPVRTSAIGAAVRRLAMSPYTMRFGEPDWAVEPFGTGRLLDIGCGAGGLLRRMTTIGWHCTGIDFSATAVAAARQAVPGALVEQATLTTFDAERPFALISMSHVLEHLPDPVANLQRCWHLLEPGGLLFVSVPNIESFEARAFGRRWIGLDIPRHLTHFSRSTLRAVLERSGFEVLSIRPAMFASTLSESATLALPLRARRGLLGSRAGRLLYFASVLPASISYVCGNEPVLEVLSRRVA